MADPTSTAPELDLESSSPALHLLFNKRDVQKLCGDFSSYCTHYYRDKQSQIPEEVVKTARMSDDIIGHVLNCNTGKSVTLGSNSTQF